MFSIAVGGPHYGHVLDACVFFCILDCSELRHRHLNITVAPPGCLVAGTVVPVRLFPCVLPQPSSRDPCGTRGSYVGL